MNSFEVSCVLLINVLTSLSFGQNISNFKKRQNSEDVFLSFKNLKSQSEPITDEDILEEIKGLQSNVTYYIHVENIPDWAQFVILQTHVYLHNVTLGYTIDKIPHKYVTGQNIGLAQNVTSSGTAQFFLENDNPFNVTALLALMAYTKNAPVPGGCNLEFPVEVAPWLQVAVTGPAVVVSTAPARGPSVWGFGGTCEVLPSLHYQAYHLYLPEKDFSSDSYFEFLRKMLTVKRITENGRKVPDLGGWQVQHVFSAYHGTGSVFAVVVYGTSAQYAAYVPALTYTCSPARYTDTCQVLTSTFSRSLCALVLFIGLFVCLFGHSFFQTELFLLSTLMGGILTYIIVAPHGFTDSTNMVISTVGGVTAGNVWLLLWWVFGSPLLSVFMATITLGYLVASVIFYTFLADLPYMVGDLNYWLAFLSIMLIVSVACAPQPNRVNILACSVVGSYAAIVPVDHYVGANLKYIFINTVRRATVPGFNKAIIDPPFQMKDFILVTIWLGLAVVGFVMQSQRFGDRPAFPPSPHPWGTPVTPTVPRHHIPAPEQRPLLAHSPGSDSVFS